MTRVCPTVVASAQLTSQVPVLLKILRLRARVIAIYR